MKKPAIYYKTNRPKIGRFLIIHWPICCLHGLIEIACHQIPVDHAHKSLDIISPAILVFQVVSMFPDIHSEQRDIALGKRAVLIGS